MPSDAEDTFFFSGDEGDDYTRGKKRRRLEAGRAERMEALRLRMEKEAKEEEARRKEAQEVSEVWGGHDEEVSIKDVIIRERISSYPFRSHRLLLGL